MVGFHGRRPAQPSPGQPALTHYILHPSADLQGCRLYVASRQVRLHASTDCQVYLRVRSAPIIEHCDRLGFGPYAPAYPAAPAHLAAAGLDQDGAQWREVQDFGWLRAAASPHWRVLEEGERVDPPPPGGCGGVV